MIWVDLYFSVWCMCMILGKVFGMFVVECVLLYFEE